MIRNIILGAFALLLWMESSTRDEQREREREESIKEFQRSYEGL